MRRRRLMVIPVSGVIDTHTRVLYFLIFKKLKKILILSGE